MSLHSERGAMVIDDVAELPSRPLVIAEGTPVPASIFTNGLADATTSVWLLPTAAFQSQQLAARRTPDGQARLYRRLREAITADAADHGLPVEIVDGSRSLVEVTSAIERRFAVPLSKGPFASGTDERRLLLREANLAIVEQIRGFLTRSWADRSAGHAEHTFVCECGDPTCRAHVIATVASAGEPLLSPGHG